MRPQLFAGPNLSDNPPAVWLLDERRRADATKWIIVLQEERMPIGSLLAYSETGNGLWSKRTWRASLLKIVEH